MRTDHHQTPPLKHEIARVLLLDDDALLADSLRHLLDERNYLVTCVSNGVEGIREIMEADFDVIVCDLLMPKMSGDVFFNAVEHAKPHLASRFIFITGHAGDIGVDRFLRETKAAVLYKPLRADELARTIESVRRKTRLR
ncbi:MAG: response regulator [Verrucomicrobiota bacterium]|nr:response regulator [Verrucomicrobiota bacterium]